MRSSLPASIAQSLLRKYKAISQKIQSFLYFLFYPQVGYLRGEARRQGKIFRKGDDEHRPLRTVRLPVEEEKPIFEVIKDGRRLRVLGHDRRSKR
jgi:hypothetical protein